MNFTFKVPIWSNREQRNIGTSIGNIKIDEEDLTILKKVYEYYLSIMEPECGWRSFKDSREHSSDCEFCNGGKPHLVWTYSENEDKLYLDTKYILPLSSLKLISISIIFSDYKYYYKDNYKK